MFRKSFQGGSHVEVFNPIKKELLSLWSISKNVKKEYDKIARTYAYCMKGESTLQHMVIPKDKKISLGLVQPHVVLQLFLTGEHHFTLEMRIACDSGNHKRITLLTHKKEIQKTSLFAAIPLTIPHKFIWMHLCVNLADLLSELWDERFRSIDSISLSGNCRVRQIYTVHESLILQNDCTRWHTRYLDKLPKPCHFPLNVEQSFHLVAKTCLRKSNDVDIVTNNSPWISLSESDALGKPRKKTYSVVSGGEISQKSASSIPLKSRLQKSNSVFSAKSRSSRPTSCSTVRSAPERLRITVTSRPVSTPSESLSKSASCEDVSAAFCILHGSESMDSAKQSEEHSSASISERMQEGRGIADILPRYKSRDVWIPPLSPVSNALSLSRAIVKEHNLQKDSEQVKSVTDIWKEFLSEHEDPSGTNQSSPEDMQNDLSYKNNIPPYDLGSLCALHRQQYQDLVAGSYHSLVGGVKKDNCQHLPRAVRSADGRCGHSSSQLNSTYNLDIRKEGTLLGRCFNHTESENVQPTFLHRCAKHMSSTSLASSSHTVDKPRPCPHRENIQPIQTDFHFAHRQYATSSSDLNSTYTVGQFSFVSEGEENKDVESSPNAAT